MWYKVDFSKLSKTLIPLCIRKSFIVDFIKVMLSPVLYLHDLWVAYYTTSWTKVCVKPQVDILQRYLQDKYDDDTIKLNSPDALKTPGLYFKSEDKTKTILYFVSEEQTPYYIGNELYVPSGYNITISAGKTQKTMAHANEILNDVRNYKPVGRSLNPAITWVLPTRDE